MAQAKIIDGKAFAAGLRERIGAAVKTLQADHGLTPGLAVILVGENPASEVYVRNKAKQTRETAKMYGFLDRGLLQPGYKADVNVIDLDALAIAPPRMVHDLPAGGRRLIQKIDGYRYTVCGGEVTYDQGEPTGAMPGKLIRGPQGA